MSRRRSVLYISPVAHHGGAETVLLNILQHQDVGRYRPYLCLLQDGPLADECRAVVGDVHVFSTRRLRSLSALSTLGRLRALIAETRADIVFGNMAMGQAFGSLAALGTRTTPVWFQHGIVETPDVVDTLAMRLPSALTFVPSLEAERALRKNSPNAHVRTIQEGIDSARFDPAAVRRGSLRRELGIDVNAPLIATVGRLQRSKGQMRFLVAAALVSRRIPSAHFVIVGGEFPRAESGYVEELRRLACASVPDGHVHFLGHRDDMPAVLADIDVLMQCPIGPESFGLALVEAMAMGVPVVSVRAWGPAEIIDDDRTGVLVDRAEPELLADAVSSLIGDPVRRCAIGHAARRRVQEKFSARRMVREIETEIDRVLDRA